QGWTTWDIQRLWYRHVECFSQSCDHRRCGRETCRWIFSKSTQDHPSQRGRDRRIDEHRSRGGQIEMLHHDFTWSPALKREHASADLVENDPKGIDVTALIARSTHHLLGGSVVGRTQPPSTHDTGG